MAKRNLYLTNIPVEEALERFRGALGDHSAIGDELIEVIDSLDRITARAVFAHNSSPLYDSAAMDGIAVVSAHTRGASETNPLILRPDDDFIPIDTGDPIRPPYDAVIMAEDVLPCEGGAVGIRAAAAAWQHVRPVGEDIVQGEMILPGSHKIRAIDIGVLLSGGITQITVQRKPTVAIIPTGTELIEPCDQKKDGAIIESNSRMFEALVVQNGGNPTRFPPVADDYDLIKAILTDATERYDMTLVSAGTSAGREDYTAGLLRELGTVAVHGVATKPGKPVILAAVRNKPVIGIPGYPVSAYLSYQNFVAPILTRLSGQIEPPAPTVQATMTRRLVSSLKYREYVRVKIGQIGDRLVASPLARGAGAAMSLVRADGFCIIGQDCEGIEAGSQVDVVLCRGLDELKNTVVSIGSHDLILDILADMLPARSAGLHLSSSHVGSMGGLMALKNGEAHLAPIHLLDETTGVYNIPIIKSLLPGRRMALIKGVGRVQGIIVRRGNPLGIADVGDLVRCVFVNRQRGAGTRILLDYQLKIAGIDPAEIKGYERESATHMAVAAAVQNGSADAGMGILSAARAMDLDFVPIGNEQYDFAVPAEFLELAHIHAFVEMLKTQTFKQRIAELGGYTTDNCGSIVFVD